MKKGLRLRVLQFSVIGSKNKEDLMKKGLRHHDQSILPSSFKKQRRPYEKGIATMRSTTIGPIKNKEDLMKKGLRPFISPPLWYNYENKEDLMKKGLRRLGAASPR